jgi:glycosyl transferase, family 25
MQIFVINLDRNPMRWNRMAKILAGLDFRRVTAVDGKNLGGPEYNKPGRQISHEMLSCYNRACILSHRIACQEFLGGSDAYCCVLEDDILISPDFGQYMNRTDWIPSDAHLVKIETTRNEICVSTKTVTCLNRAATLLRSSHLGSAAYVISRRGAEKILELSAAPDRSIDRVLFDEDGINALRPYQILPALCIQYSWSGQDLLFPEMESTIQPKSAIPADPARKAVRYSVLYKIQREFSRPFRQASTWTALRCQGIRRLSVPFA